MSKENRRNTMERIRGSVRRLANQAWLNSTLILGISLGGLLIAILVAGVVGLVINYNTGKITEHALDHDVNLEDEGDDLRAAVLDLRHYHRDFFFVGPESRQALSNLTRAYLELEAQIRDYAEIEHEPEDDIVTAARLQELADAYWSTFRPAIDVYESDPAAFELASAAGLATLEEMESAAQDIDRVGEERAAQSLANVDQETRTARNILIALLGGLVLSGIGLAWIAVRVVAHIRQLYVAQQDTSAKLAQSLNANTSFIADASHELRTPLTVLRGNAEAGLALNRTSEYSEIFEDIVAESARMTKLVDDLLLLARSDASAVPLQLETVDASEWLQALAGRAAILAREHGASLNATLTGSGQLTIDVERVAQAIMILVDNSAKYSQPPGRIWLVSSSWRDELMIEVADRGVGIAADDLPRIFDRFYRGSSQYDRDGAGAGLGLPIAKSIVEAHGGRIEAHSQLGEGTRLRIHLPLTRVRATVPELVAPTRSLDVVS
jgi:signal transduction histidine kinase